MSTMKRENFKSSGLKYSALAMAAIFLVACSTTPLPPWPSDGSATSTGGDKRLPPVGSVTLSGQPAHNSVVAARFPDPSVHYVTPGLQDGREAFSSNEEIRSYLTGLAAAPGAGISANLQSIGKSQQGADIYALMLSKGSGSSAVDFARSGKPTVLFMAQQHGNEPAGSEALLVAAKQLLSGPWSGVLNSINVILVPRANPDAAVAQTRALGNAIDLNRDHLLLRSPEARALARLVRDYRPMVIVDNHEYPVGGPFENTFNSLQSYDAMVQYANTPNIGEFVVKASSEWFTEPMFQALKKENLSAQWYFVTSEDPQDLSVSMGSILPDTGRNVNGLKNAVSLLIETRGVGLGREHIQRRVHTHVVAVGSVLEQAASRASHLSQVQGFVERDAASQACQGNLVINAAQTQEQREITMLNPVTGADEVRTLPWKSSLQLRSTQERNRPCGYLLAGSESDVVARLQMLGLSVLRVAESGSLKVQQYVETGRSQAPIDNTQAAQAAQAGQSGSNSVVLVKVDLAPLTVDVPPGSYYIPMGQPLANLAAAALEPDTQSSYFAHGIQRNLGNLMRATEPPALVFEEVE